MINKIDETEVPGLFFSDLSPAPVDEPFTLNADFLVDSNPSKVNLGIGVYRTDDGNSWPLPAVETAEDRMSHPKQASRHDYLPIQGDVEFLQLARDVVFGEHHERNSDAKSDVIDRRRIVSVQTVSGTGANHLGASYLSRLGAQRVWIPDPTWSNHEAIWELVGVSKLHYPYFDPQSNKFDFAGMIKCLEEEAMPRDVLLLHACAHNPTGADPTKEQWKAIANICASKNLLPFFDNAYQGFASGDLDEDAWAIRHFANHHPGTELCVAQSFSKNFGLYGQRVGALHVVVSNSKHNALVESNLSHIIRGEFSMAPRHGSGLVKTVLRDQSLRSQWIRDLQTMSDRIRCMREQLYAELRHLGTPGSWEHIIQQTGMFSYLGLTREQVATIRSRHHIYMLMSGRISISGLSNANIDRVARAIDDVVRHPEANECGAATS